jgi:hypothetical protein
VYENRSQHVTNDESKQLEDEDIPKLKVKLFIELNNITL